MDYTLKAAFVGAAFVLKPVVPKFNVPENFLGNLSRQERPADVVIQQV